MALSLGQIIESLGGRLVGDPQHLIQKLAPLDTAQVDALSFLSNPKYQSQLATTQAGCVIVSPAVEASTDTRTAMIVADNPYHYFARLTQLWRQHLPKDDAPLVHPSAVIHPSASVHATARIGPLCVVERGVHIGANTWLKSGITVGEDCHIGERCIIHAGVVIGADGFGFAMFEGRWEKIEQLGAVHIGNDVEIGANTCIDRGALDDTVLEDGVKLDNLVQIGHNVHVGANTAMAGCAGVAGSARIGANCTVGGGAVVLGHLQLADGVHISAASVVMRSIRQPGQYSGVFPIDDNASWEKNAATLRQLHRLRDRIKSLESALESQKK
ncbi:UDP-3-O-(3-hydroxymyristoyl)glucosamine N-acyltransferase [Limnohabitans sp. TS-CS-82]|uniref:UDP-3-O-(3-hydroxymyristoyl)glucosamine N-acyltransferase n=1 Tax=Limnohabitans sp. TS-CS-82 TaxID=2094193 RepID=UPI000CF1F87D|nr:UDP-3-O-(3-hydroxymyristoyl)glucosamine N-acyltransferase [Limnohabitans sp. TS-CS-82]PQA84188.1 UDP-3-O-(3-hydroxymyristoyl)glucosamine N-acyltransferase [Limnohabitans sp. TS-CS-82]